MLESVSISPNDGGRMTFCFCSTCKAYDAPEAEKVKLRGWAEDGSEGDWPSLTERHLTFYDRIAQIVGKRYPDRFLGAYAYSVYRTAPVRTAVEPNIIIGFVGFGYLNDEARQKSREMWDGWRKAAKYLFLRPNLLGTGEGMPVVYARKLAEDVRHCAATGMIVTDFDCCYQHWATTGLQYYVLAKMLWDPKTDVDAVMDDYCRSGFGNAAEPVKRYFAALEELTNKVAATNEYGGRKSNPDFFMGHYTDEFLGRCQALLDEGKRLATDDPQALKRLAFLEIGVKFARLNRNAVVARAAFRSGETKDAKPSAEAAAARDAFYKQIGLTWALNSPYLKFYGF